MTSKPGLSSRKTVTHKRLLIRHWFSIGILALVWARILMFPSETGYLVWPVSLGIGAGIYASLQMIQPLRRRESVVPNLLNAKNRQLVTIKAILSERKLR